MSRALYRKYRSMSLKELIGQAHVTDTLQRAIDQGKISHAYLFTGPRGIGKTSVARILAHMVNNLPYTDESNHLDIIEIDAASNRRIDDIRELRDKVRTMPTSAPYKVYIIDEVHMLTGESFNALLKTLEEPPEHVIFILATTEVHKLPATIVSRTQRFHFKPVETAVAAQYLGTLAKKEGVKINDEALTLIARHGEGSMRDSISLLDQLSSLKGETISANDIEELLGLAPTTQVSTIINAITTRQPQELQILLNDLLYQKGVSPQVLVKQLLASLRDVAVTNPALYDVMNNLLEVNKSSDPSLKLMITLLKAASPLTTDKPAQALKVTLPVAKPATAVKHVEPAQKAPKTSPSGHGKQAEPITVAVKQSRNLTVFNVEKWPDIVSVVRKQYAVLFSVIGKAEMRIENGELHLHVRYKLHKNKLEDSKYKAQLVAAVNSLGLDCPKIVVLVDPALKPPVLHKKEPETDEPSETTQGVLAMMGGGEIVSAHI